MVLGHPTITHPRDQMSILKMECSAGRQWQMKHLGHVGYLDTLGIPTSIQDIGLHHINRSPSDQVPVIPNVFSPSTRRQGDCSLTPEFRHKAYILYVNRIVKKGYVVRLHTF